MRDLRGRNERPPIADLVIREKEPPREDRKLSFWLTGDTKKEGGSWGGMGREVKMIEGTLGR